MGYTVKLSFLLYISPKDMTEVHALKAVLWQDGFAQKKKKEFTAHIELIG